jgi:arsenical pump membrane protein
VTSVSAGRRPGRLPAVLSVGLLVAALIMLLFGHRRIPTWVAVLGPVAVGLATTAIDLDVAGDALSDLDASLAFLLIAVPLSVLLGEVGFFDAAAERVAVGHRLVPSLWVFAALVTTVLNLDAAIVLLTPLYIRIARLHGLDPLRLAFQPVLLSSLASSALPVSNLTNLIAAERFDLGVHEFLWRLGPASVTAAAVGWLVYRRLPSTVGPDVADQVADDDMLPIGGAEARSALAIGAPAVVVLLVGFVAGDAVGIAPWMTAAVVVVALIVVTRRLPWRALPVEAAAVAAGLGVLAAAAAPHLAIDRVLGGVGPGERVVHLLAGIAGADAANNLPALLVGMPYLDESSIWPFLAGVNLGPILWVTGSLAGLLWLDIVRREGIAVSYADYAKVGLRVGVPAIVAAAPWLVVVG